MKKIFAVLIFLLAVPFHLSAQISLQPFLGAQAGTTFPASPKAFNTYWSLGFYGALNFEKPLSDLFSIGGDANYAMYTVDGNGGTTGDQLSFISIAPFVKLGDNVGIRNISLFARFGVGIGVSSATTIMQKSTIIYQKESQTGYAIMLGGGIDIHLPSLDKITFEVSYRVNHVPDTDYQGALVGFGYHFRL